MMGSMMRRAMIGDSATLNVDFTSMTNGGQLANAGFTFTNATTTARTYINASGIVATATTNEPRFDYTGGSARGLLLEGTATNLLQQSADWTVSPWSKPAQITWDGTTYATAPDGTTSAKQITVTGGSSAAIAQAVTTGTNRTISLWLRAGSLTSFSVGAFDSGGTTWGNNADSTCRIISGPGSAPVQQVGGLWSITGLSTTQWTRVQIFRSTTYTNLLAYPGSSSGTINGTAFMWGMQMEDGNGASSYIPTGASSATRLADSCVMGDISALNYSTQFGSIYWSGIINKQPTSYITLIGFMTAGDQPTYETFGNALNYFTAARGASLSAGGANEVSRPYTLGSLIKYASAINTVTDPIVRVNLNGSASSANKTGTGDLYAATRFVIGRQPSSTYGANYPSVTIALVKYWPTAKTASELNALTT
jgi:hypothetical protein